ncbi:ABC transporter substrate-binding protein [Paenibacillus rigui]|uniref:ABC transporter substrate-binding protein n=1 Tax=Paenibacillus rigui TaxID=554312 RepID=A0A229UX43_9BACL|nr:extracellular solute-binding protein [Paenibacillus rigui]OXM87725.1 ABC transporter substrate-binding protein [Paenibacillus rigui]
MKINRVLSTATAVTLVAALIAGCGSNTADEAKNGAASGDSSKPVTLELFQYSPEMADAMHQLADQYHKENPNVTINVTINQDNYFPLLKTKINSGNTPDIFMTGAYNDNVTYQDYSYDLTNEPFMKNIVDTAKTGVTLNGKQLGYPLILQSYSFIYNKKLFADAGITELPKTYAELEAAAKKLQDKGITPFANAYKEWWVMEQTLTPVMASTGGNYQQTFADVNSGKKKLSDLKELSNVFPLLDLTLKYSNPKPLETDFNSSVALFAQGKAAILHNGSWAEDSIRKIDPKIDMGYLPHPVGDDASKAGLMVDSNVVYRINKDSKNLKEVLKFFEWLTTSDYGKKFVPNVVKQISTIKDAPFPDAQLAKETNDYLKNGKTYPWVKGYYPDGYEQQAGQILQQYAGQVLNKEQTIDQLNSTWAKLAAAAK